MLFRSTMWHELLRSFIQVKKLSVSRELVKEVSRAMDEVGSDLGFLPNLRDIVADVHFFSSFIETRRVVGRPVQLSRTPVARRHGQNFSKLLSPRPPAMFDPPRY